MSANEKQSQFRLGFLTAVEVPGGGFMGGLLVTNHLGRPLEFQCTAPVKPNRTQEILYGPTLVPFLLGELIGRTLIEKAAVKPDLVLIEQEDILELRNHVSVPVACLANSSTENSPADSLATVEESTGVDGYARLGRQGLRFHAAHQADSAIVAPHVPAVPRDADLREPFQRVREALHEAMQPGTMR